jgi:putative lipoic acid-binding regulatory protein
LSGSVTGCICFSVICLRVIDAPKIEFPCDYPIKVIGINHHRLRDVVVEVVRGHAPDLQEETISLHDSRQGTYRSIRFSITATGEQQLLALHRALLEEPLVKLVL